MFDHQAVVEEAYNLLTNNSILTEAQDIFKGYVYKDKSRLAGGRLKRNIFDFRKHLTSTIDKLQPLFIVGYNLEDSHLFYEIWYLPFDGEYIIVDKFGKRTTKFKKHSTITKAVDELVDMISTIDPEDLYDLDELELDVDDLEDELDDAKKRVEFKKLEKEFGKASRGAIKQFECKSYEEIETLLEQNITSRGLLADLINASVVEYKETRMNRNKINSAWKFLLGRDITYPTKYLGGGIKNAVLKLIGKDREASFVVGYSLADKLNFEIWFVKSINSGKGSFYVFDITSAKVLAKNLPNMRQAYAHIAKKITTKV